MILTDNDATNKTNNDFLMEKREQATCLATFAVNAL